MTRRAVIVGSIPRESVMPVFRSLAERTDAIVAERQGLHIMNGIYRPSTIPTGNAIGLVSSLHQGVRAADGPIALEANC